MAGRAALSRRAWLQNRERDDELRRLCLGRALCAVRGSAGRRGHRRAGGELYEGGGRYACLGPDGIEQGRGAPDPAGARSEEHTSELQSLMRISYAVFCLKKK